MTSIRRPRHLMLETSLAGMTGPPFEALALPHLPALYRLALRMAGDPSAAEDLVQETYLRALRSFATLRDPDRAKAWLFKILSRLVVDRHRSLRREVPL